MRKPRGPRPLPALPTSQPSSPTSPASLALPLVVPIKVTPPLRLNTKVCPPPPTYEEAMSAVQTLPPQSQPEQLAFAFEEMEAEDDAATQYMTSPIEDTIDWDSIEDRLMHDG